MFRVGQSVETWIDHASGYGDEIGPIAGEIYIAHEILRRSKLGVDA